MYVYQIYKKMYFIFYVIKVYESYFKIIKETFFLPKRSDI